MTLGCRLRDDEWCSHCGISRNYPSHRELAGASCPTEFPPCYHAFRRKNDVLIQRPGGDVLPARYELWRGTAVEFDWGNMNAGAAFLSLSLLADFLMPAGDVADAGADKLAATYHQQYKLRVLSSLRDDEWILLPNEILSELVALGCPVSESAYSSPAQPESEAKEN